MLGKKIKNIIASDLKILNWKDVILLAVSVVLGIYLKWSISEVAVFVVFIFIILHPLPSRFLAMPALFFLILTPFFLIFKQELIAEQVAIYCYYFLVMTVIMGIYEIYSERSTEEEA
jgi:hypothetical protein